MVLVDAKQRCSCRFMAPPARSIFTLPGVEGKSSSSSARIFFVHDAVVVALLLSCETTETKNPILLLFLLPDDKTQRTPDGRKDQGNKEGKNRRDACRLILPGAYM
jgi:hypothetical protein